MTLFWILFAIALATGVTDVETSLHNIRHGQIEAGPLAFIFRRFGTSRFLWHLATASLVLAFAGVGLRLGVIPGYLVCGGLAISHACGAIHNATY